MTDLALPLPTSKSFRVVGQKCPLHPPHKLAGRETQADLFSLFCRESLSLTGKNYLSAVLMCCGSLLSVPEDVHRTQKREVLHICQFLRYRWKGWCFFEMLFTNVRFFLLFFVEETVWEWKPPLLYNVGRSLSYDGNEVFTDNSS